MKCVVVKNQNFLKNKNLKDYLLGAKIPILANIPLVNTLFQNYKLKAIVNKFLLAGYNFTPEMRLRQPGFRYSNCGPFN